MNKMYKQMRTMLAGVVISAALNWSGTNIEESSKNKYRRADSDFEKALRSVDDKEMKDAIRGLYWNNRNLKEDMILGKPGVQWDFIGSKVMIKNTDQVLDYTRPENVYMTSYKSQEMFKEKIVEDLGKLYGSLKRNPIALNDTLVNVVIESQKNVDQYTYNTITRQPNKEPRNIIYKF